MLIVLFNNNIQTHEDDEKVNSLLITKLKNCSQNEEFYFLCKLLLVW